MCPIKKQTLDKILAGENYEHEGSDTNGLSVVSFCRFDNNRVKIQHRCCVVKCHDLDMDVESSDWYENRLPKILKLISYIEKVKSEDYISELEWQMSRLMNKRDRFLSWINEKQ